MDDPLLPVQAPATAPAPARLRACLAGVKLIITANGLAIVSGPLACMLACLYADVGGPKPRESNKMLGVLAWIFLWWLTDAIPMAITSLSPLFLFPLFSLASSDVVAKSYMNDTIALVLGSFTLALAVEQYNVHRRLALNVYFLSLPSYPLLTSSRAEVWNMDLVTPFYTIVHYICPS